jgi:hypothetical protein
LQMKQNETDEIEFEAWKTDEEMLGVSEASL